MVHTTPTYWDVDGESLNTYAYNISTLGDGRSRVPDLRGSDIEVPYRRGTVWVPKIADTTDLTLSMWVLGLQDTGEVSDESIQAQFEYNLAHLRRLMWNERKLVTLTKRFYRGGSIISASAKAQFKRGLEPNMYTPGYGRMAVTFNLPDPFFYGEEVVVPLDEESAVIEVDGDADTNNIVLEMDAGTTLTNTTEDLSLSISCSQSGVVKVYDKVVDEIASNASLSYSGSDEWFLLSPGDNSLSCSGGSVTIRYRPAYF